MVIYLSQNTIGIFVKHLKYDITVGTDIRWELSHHIAL